MRQEQWGWSEVIPVPGDYDGDGRTDLGVYYPHTWTAAQPANDTNRPMWYIQRSSDGALWQQRWGYCVDLPLNPVQADYDGDCTTDIALYDPNIAVWYILRSTDWQLHQEQWGFIGAVPAAGDYDGDGKVDIAVYHPGTGDWFIHQSFSDTLRQQNWGWDQAIPVTLRQQVSHRSPSFY